MISTSILYNANIKFKIRPEEVKSKKEACFESSVNRRCWMKTLFETGEE